MRYRGNKIYPDERGWQPENITPNLRSLDFSVNRFFMKLSKTSNMQMVTEIQLPFGFRPPSAIITDRVKPFCTFCHATTNYISFLSCLYSVGFLCELLFDIIWFILEYIINCIGKDLQVLICLVESLASIFLSLFIVFVLLTGSIARSAKRRLFNLLRGRFWGFSPRKGDTLHRWGWNLARSPPPCQISPPSVQR